MTCLLQDNEVVDPQFYIVSGNNDNSEAKYILNTFND